MKYAFKSIKEDYQQIDYQSAIQFKNDVIYFENIIDMYRHLFYASNNKFEIAINNQVFQHRNLLKTIVIHGSCVKLILDNKNIRNIFYTIYLIVYLKMIKIKHPLREFEPMLKCGNMNGTKIYILEGYVINKNKFDYKSLLINADSDLSKFPFKFKVDSELVNIDVVDYEYQFDAELDTEGYSILENKIAKYRNQPTVFIYDIQKEVDGLILSVFFQGYQNYNHNFIIDTKNKYKILPSDDWKYYSKISKHFKSNFIKIKFETINEVVQFQYLNKLARIILSRNLESNKIYHDTILRKLDASSFMLDINIDKYKDKYYYKIEKLKSTNSRHIYIFSDRQDRADDNAENLYRYYKEHSDKEIYFAISKDCKCWDRLEKEGFNLIEFGSSQHKEKYLLADKLISSHAARRIYDPFFPQKDYYNLETFKLVFLQHGIIMGEHHGFLDKINNPIDLVISSTYEEKKLISKFSGYDKVTVSGLARYDNYNRSKSSNKPFIIYAPSWNTKYRDDLANSKYIQEIEKVLNSVKINDILNKLDINIHFILHPEFIKENIELRNSYNYKLMSNQNFLYSQELSNCLGLITDYSSLFFDILYQGKFVIHHQPYELHHLNDQLTGYQEALYKCYEIEQLEIIISELAKNNFKIDEGRKGVIQAFFPYYDNKFCKRNYQAIESL